MRVRELMQTTVHTVNEDAKLSDAARVLSEKDCGIVPVVDEKGRVRGVLTDRDICLASYAQGKALRQINVADVMTREILSCRGEESVPSALRLLGERHVRRVLVMNSHEELEGILSLDDLARAGGEGKVDAYDLVASFAAICKPEQKKAG